MAQATGYFCDVCKTFEARPNSGVNLPDGWMKLTITPTDPSFDLCSNKCLLELAKERRAAERPNRVTKEYNVSPDGAARKAEGARKANHVRYHVNRNIVDVDCRFCQEITSPEDIRHMREVLNEQEEEGEVVSTT